MLLNDNLPKMAGSKTTFKRRAFICVNDNLPKMAGSKTEHKHLECIHELNDNLPKMAGSKTPNSSESLSFII